MSSIGHSSRNRSHQITSSYTLRSCRSLAVEAAIDCPSTFALSCFNFFEAGKPAGEGAGLGGLLLPCLCRGLVLKQPKLSWDAKESKSISHYGMLYSGNISGVKMIQNHSCQRWRAPSISRWLCSCDLCRYRWKHSEIIYITKIMESLWLYVWEYVLLCVSLCFDVWSWNPAWGQITGPRGLRAYFQSNPIKGHPDLKLP